LENKMARAPIEQDGPTPTKPLPNLSEIATQAANAILTNKPLPISATTAGYAAAQAAQAPSPTRTATGTSYKGTGANRVLVTTYSDGTTSETPAPDGSGVTKTVVSVIKNADGTVTSYYNDGSSVVSGSATPAAPTGVTQSAKDIVNGYLKEAGLSGLADNAWSQWNSGTSAEQIMDWVRQQPEYAVRFPAMATLRSAGRSITESSYILKEQADIDMMTTYGIPADIATNRNLLGSLISNNVNQVTLQQRLMAGQDSILSQDKNVLDYAKQTFGLTSGDLLSFVLNPDISLPVLQEKAKAIQIGGAAFQAKQALDANQALSLAAAGVTAQQAQQGFGNIAQQGQFQQALPGDISGNLTNEELINAQFNMDPVALAKLKKVSATRANEFQGGGQFTASATGVTGIGSAPQV
jgi:hypothetical protein